MRLGKIAIAVVDTCRLFRAGLVCLLSQEVELPIAEMEDVEELAVRSGMRGFDLVLLEAQEKDGCDGAVCRTRALLPSARIAVLADKFSPVELRQSISEGADGYLLKDISSETLYAALELIMTGEKILPVPFAEMLLCDGNHTEIRLPNTVYVQDGTFSDREVDILRCLADGASNKKIALRLNIAEATVKVHLKSILKKTRATNRTQAAIWAVQRGLSEVAAAACITLGACEFLSGYLDVFTGTMV